MKYCKVRDVKSPNRGTSKSAGIDFFIPNDFEERLLLPGQDILIPSGIKAEIPEGYMLMGADKSGIATSGVACVLAGREPKAKKDTDAAVIIVGAKIVDEDYQGEIHIHLFNAGLGAAYLKPGMKISQFILVPVLYAELEEVPEENLFKEKSERGDEGFSSTGIF